MGQTVRLQGSTLEPRGKQASVDPCFFRHSLRAGFIIGLEMGYRWHEDEFFTESRMSRFMPLMAAALLLAPLAAGQPRVAPVRRGRHQDVRIEKDASVISARAAEAKAAADLEKAEAQLAQARKAHTEARSQAREAERKAVEALRATDTAQQAQAQAKEAQKGARAAADAAQKAAGVHPAKPKAKPEPEPAKAEVSKTEGVKAEAPTEK